jgi:hypothetical protein
MRYLAQHRQSVAKHGNLHGIRVRRRTAPKRTQKPANDHQRDRMNYHTTEPAAPTSPLTSAVTLTWHPTGARFIQGR